MDEQVADDSDSGSRAAEDPPVDFAEQAVSRLASRASPFGRYRIDGEVARGGMGAILRIWDEDLHRELAMKVILTREATAGARPTAPDRARLARFLEEAQVTGQLEHPGIVPVHELGCDAQGRVYFTMKLVKGVTLKHVFELVREGKDGWSTTRALDVLLRACEAMAYAHAKEVVHRDLKPENVMVGAFGEVHVMDWGLARILGRKDGRDVRVRRDPALASGEVRGVRSQHRAAASDSPLYTMDGDVIGTPAYMPPEQAEGKVDEIGPHSDVYSVGAMLYELLAGHPPYVPPGASRNGYELWEAVRQGPPPPIAALARATPLELVAICEKAMARDARARYPDMSALASDLRAFLEHRVVAAYESGAWAEARKWIARNRALAASLAAGLLVLAAGLVVALVLKGRADESARVAETRRVDAERAESLAREEKERAEKNAEETRLVADFQLRILGELSVDEFGRALAARLRSEVEEGLREQARSAEEFDAALASFDRALASANATNVARAVLEEQVFERAARTIETEYAEQPLLAALLQAPLANTLWQLSLYELGERLARESLETRRTLLGDAHADTLRSINTLALQLRALSRHEEAEGLYREAVAGARATFGDRHPDTLTMQANLALVLQEEEELDEAEALMSETLAARRAELGDEHADTLGSMHNFATLLRVRGRMAEAELLQREVLERQRARLGGRHREALAAANNLGYTLHVKGEFAEAEALFRETLAASRETLGDEHVQTLHLMLNLGNVLRALGRLDEVESLYRGALEGYRKHVGARSRPMAIAAGCLGGFLVEQGRFAEAEPLLQETLEICQDVHGEWHPDTLRSMGNLASALQSLGRIEEAEALARDELVGSRAALGDDHPDTLERIEGLAAMLRAQGRLAEAEPLYREALAGCHAKLGQDDPVTFRSTDGLSLLLQARGEFAAAQTLLEEAVERSRALSDDGAQGVQFQEKLRDLHRAWNAAEPGAGHK